jgi:Na+/proline symporter
MIGVGAAFYKRESDIGEYFVASRQMPTFVVVLGVSAALLSGISVGHEQEPAESWEAHEG